MLSNHTSRCTLAMIAVLASAGSAFAQTTGSSSQPPSAASGPNPPPPPSAAPPRRPNTTGGIIDAGLQFNINGQRVLISDSSYPANLIAGVGTGTPTYVPGQTGFANSIFGSAAGPNIRSGNYNVLIGNLAGTLVQDGSTNTLVGYRAGGNSAFVGSDGSDRTALGAYSAVYATNATAVGANAIVTQDNSLVLGSIAGVNYSGADTSVGIGTTAPQYKLHVIDASNKGLRIQTNTTGGTVASFGGNGAFQVDAPGVVGGRLQITEAGWVAIGVNGAPQDRLDVNGFIRARVLGGGGTTQLCLNPASQISSCGSSLRYKSGVAPFRDGLALVKQLTPISFEWTGARLRDVGLAAEDVDRIEPLLVTYNKDGEVEGVKYDRIAVVLVNAVNEQQAQLEQQARRIESQQQQIEALKALVCATNPDADACRQ